ncbi:hypothetical protein C8R45DRAFT_1070228 [Mycena sanguinolenta]|nr:hypothetical protein C8R45DRAFT_1070228 [Mycena sanguinolenta]
MQLNKFLAGARGQATAGPIQIANIRGRSARARGALFRDLGDTSNAVFKSCGMFAVALMSREAQWAVSVLICNLQSISNSNKTGELTVDTTISSFNSLAALRENDLNLPSKMYHESFSRVFYVQSSANFRNSYPSSVMR